MTFEEANKWVNVYSYRDGTDDRKKHLEAIRAFNVIYCEEICNYCENYNDCHLADDRISFCEFFTKEND